MALPATREGVTTAERPDEGSGGDDQSSLAHQLASWVRNLVSGKRSNDDLRESIEELIGDTLESEGGIDAEQRLLLTNILKLHDLTVVDVMVPRADIIAVEDGLDIEALARRFVTVGHSRMPVYRDTLDDVLGFIHIKDAMAALLDPARTKKPGDLLRNVLIVAPSMSVSDLLLDMRLSRTHMAMVVDEFGGIDGLVTIEDLMEEIVGDINDEHDSAPTTQMVQRPDGSLVLDARVALEDVEARLGPFLDEEEREEIDTIGGLVAAIAGRVPARGELLTHEPSGIEFEVLDADPRRIKRVRLRLPESFTSRTGEKD
ncbi:hemolysin family protein [Radicibacter daui]|uniref:hemolysin family protein n=1 Tax=Radicibacter daui TaxID=3064829 RepID=UPI0040468CFB